MRIYPVIMCGGAGSRLWPISRPSRPKQFVAFSGEQTLFQDTVARVRKVDNFARLIVVAGANHGAAIASQLDSDLDPVVLLEPEGRDSAAAIAAATSWVAENDPDGIVLIVASDHFIPDTDDFCRAVITAAKTAANGRIVTMGIHPTKPTTAYGYIKPSQKKDVNGVAGVAAFVEKPDIETARTYIDDGFLWNSGNFIFSAKTMAEELQQYAPEVFEAARKGVETADWSGISYKLGDAFRKAPKISVDYAVMEKTTVASVFPVSLSWSDLGAWDAVSDICTKDENGNALEGAVVTTDTKNCYVRTSDDRLVATVGVHNLAVIADDDAILVCDLDKAQSVKSVVEVLKQKNLPQLNIPDPVQFTNIEEMVDCYQQWLFAAALPLWWSIGADHNAWGFHDYLTVNGQPMQSDRRARVQARQTYVFGTAGKLGWTGPWRQGVRHGVASLQSHYQRPDGFIRSLVSYDGAVINDQALLYDQAFTLLMFFASRTVIDDAEAQALVLLDKIEKEKRHSGGGFLEEGERPFASNPHMHLFEATLAWREVSNDSRWAELSDELARHALKNFVDPDGGFLREFFDEAWNPVAGYEGDIVEPGHQFEWAWLLLKWQDFNNDKKMQAVAEGLFSVGLRGIDYARNVPVNQLGKNLKPTTMEARLWPQTERLKAALALYARSEGKAKLYYEDEVLSAGRSLWRYLDMKISGQWHDKMNPDGSFVEEPVTASTLYHLISAVEEMQNTRVL